MRTCLLIDDFDDIEFDNNFEDDKETIEKDDAITAFLQYKIIKRTNNTSGIKSYERKIIDRINSDPNLYIGYFKASNDNIRQVVLQAIKILGYKANLNWIDTSRVTSMKNLFTGTSFNGDISKWDVSGVTDMRYTFYYSTFNGDISKWNVSNVKDATGMFESSDFDNNISNWNTSSIVKMPHMFHESSFNGDISKWDVSNVTNMNMMFCKAQFNQNISNWNTENVVHMRDIFCNSSLEKEHRPKFKSQGK